MGKALKSTAFGMQMEHTKAQVDRMCSGKMRKEVLQEQRTLATLSSIPGDTTGDGKGRRAAHGRFLATKPAMRRGSASSQWTDAVAALKAWQLHLMRLTSVASILDADHDPLVVEILRGARGLEVFQAGRLLGWLLKYFRFSDAFNTEIISEHTWGVDLEIFHLFMPPQHGFHIHVGRAKTSSEISGVCFRVGGR